MTATSPAGGRSIALPAVVPMLLAIWGGPVLAGEWRSGRALVDDLRGDNPIEEAAALDYAMGVMDAETLFEAHFPRKYTCVPVGTSGNSIRKAVLRRADANPKELQFNAAILVHNAISDAWPCSLNKTK